ncbi:MAG: acetate--CoA ligase family protein [Clostridia bacterium]|nr:acetate--CoA ligase family protein [Clostridia bacterium]MDH7572331.1 acetate--CoA ligase family protein [Clostridia bacterium]
MVGASNNPAKLGHAVVRNLVEGGYPGEVYPVNPKAGEILGRRACPSVEEVPGEVDLAVVVIPAAGVLEVARRCGEKGVRFLVVISAGFREIGGEGARREKELVDICRRYGMGLVGPNCLGVIDTYTPLNATFAPRMPRRGRIAFFSQSGALGTAILDWSLTVDLGFSRFVSLGNKAGLDEVDLMQESLADPRTQIVLCYLENVQDGGRFLSVSAEVTRRKPVLVIKSGVSEAGARAASSHTGALAGSDVAYDTAFAQAGLFRVRTLEQLFDFALAFSSQPLPRGNRLAVVTNAGGPGILASDAAEAEGLALARLRRQTITELGQGLPREASLYNPVDVLGDASPERYTWALDRVAADPKVDMVLILLAPQAGSRPEETAQLIVEWRRQHQDKPLAAVFMGGASVEGAVERLKKADIPCYFSPERAVASLAALARYAARCRRAMRAPSPCPPLSGREKARMAAVLDRVRADRRVVLLASEALAVLESGGIPCAPSRLAAGPEDAVRAAEELGFPVVLKVASPHITHKTDVGGVRVGLESPDEVRRAYLEIMENVHRYLPRAEVYGVEVQRLMPPGTELVVGFSRDLQFGPLLMFGLGGVYVNLLRDVSFRLTRGFGPAEAEEMIRETKAYTLLRGYRGEPPRDVAAVVETLCRVARLAEEFPEVVEMDINPLVAYERGLAALDAKMTIGDGGAGA